MSCSQFLQYDKTVFACINEKFEHLYQYMQNRFWKDIMYVSNVIQNGEHFSQHKSIYNRPVIYHVLFLDIKHVILATLYTKVV